MPPQRFFWKLFLSLVSTTLLFSFLFGIQLYRHLYKITLSNLQFNLQKETEVLAGIVLNSPETLLHPERIADVVHTDDRITIISPEGKVLADNWAAELGKEVLENHADRPEVQAALKGQPAFIRRFSQTLQREMLYYAILLKKKNQPVFVLRLSFALNTFYSQMSEIRNRLLFSVFLIMLLCLPFAYLVSHGITKRIEKMRESAGRLAAGDLSQRVSPQGSLEFQELARDFNKMADQLQQQIVSMQHEYHRRETLLSKMVEGVLAVDKQGRAVFANAAFCRMVGSKLDRVQGKSFLEITRNDELSDYIVGLLRTNDPNESKEIRMQGPEGERIFAVQASRVKDDAGSTTMVLLVFHDISGIKRVEQIRKDFVANVSHELRTPLTAIRGSVEALLDGAYHEPSEAKKFLEIMDKQLRNIQNVVTDMLRLAAVEDAHIPTRREFVELKPFLEDILSVVEPLSQKKRQTLVVTIPDQPLQISVDPMQMGDALMNLLDNAVKYTDEGGRIELSVKPVDSGLQFQVTDNGPGIPPDQLPRIFERFYRVDKSRSREMGGTGLGLAITKHVVENHNGTITVQSEPGRGTTFLIHLKI